MARLTKRTEDMYEVLGAQLLRLVESDLSEAEIRRTEVLLAGIRAIEQSPPQTCPCGDNDGKRCSLEGCPWPPPGVAREEHDRRLEKFAAFFDPDGSPHHTALNLLRFAFRDAVENATRNYSAQRRNITLEHALFDLHEIVGAVEAVKGGTATSHTSLRAMLNTSLAPHGSERWTALNFLRFAFRDVTTIGEPGELRDHAWLGRQRRALDAIARLDRVAMEMETTSGGEG